LTNGQEVQGNTRVPFSDLDLDYLTVEPSWGRESTTELKRKLVSKASEVYQCENCESTTIYNDEKLGLVCGNCKSQDIRRYVDVETIWGEMGYLTRDLRLGNIGTGELKDARHFLDLAGDCLREGYNQAFLLSLSRVANILELSQSKRGFFRKRRNTVTSERVDHEPNSRRIMGGKREE